MAGRLVLVLPDVYGVPMSEVFEWSPLAPAVLPGLQGALGEARRPPPVPAGPRSESERFLAATVARWNAVATELDLPRCDPYVDEEEAVLRCIFPEELIPGARARVDFIARRDRVLLEFAVDNEVSPPVQAIALALGPLMPDGVRLEILPSGHVYALADVTTATSEDLAELWVRGLRTLKVLWAATYPWDDLNPLDAEELGFSEGDFSLDGCEAELGHLVSCGAVYMSHFARQIDAGGGYVDRD